MHSPIVGKPRNSYSPIPYSTDFPWRDPEISRPRSFYGQNICSEYPEFHHIYFTLNFCPRPARKDLNVANAHFPKIGNMQAPVSH